MVACEIQIYGIKEITKTLEDRFLEVTETKEEAISCLRLLQNELMKMFKRPGTYVMIAVTFTNDF